MITVSYTLGKIPTSGEMLSLVLGQKQLHLMTIILPKLDIQVAVRLTPFYNLLKPFMLGLEQPSRPSMRCLTMGTLFIVVTIQVVLEKTHIDTKIGAQVIKDGTRVASTEHQMLVVTMPIITLVLQ